MVADSGAAIATKEQQPSLIISPWGDGCPITVANLNRIAVLGAFDEIGEVPPCSLTGADSNWAPRQVPARC